MNWLVKNAQEWFEKASHDLQSANLLRKAGIYDTALFHCQQAAEKAVKGFLTFHDKVFDKDHNIPKHLTKATSIEASFELWKEAARLLSKYAVLPRYPDDVLEISAKSCAMAYKYAKSIFDHSLSVLPKEVRPVRALRKKRTKKKTSSKH